MQVLLFSGILLTLCVSSWGLVYNAEDFRSVGSSCAPITPDPSLNMTWFQSVEYWHVSMWSKTTLMNAMKTSLSAEEFANLTESELKKSCFGISKFQKPPAKVPFYGFGRVLFEYQTPFPLFRDGVIDWVKDGVYQVTSNIVLTDNKSYIFSIDELGGGVRGYWIGTLGDSLSPTEWDKIYRRIESFNFPRDFTYPLESSCADDEYINRIKSKKN